MKNNEKQVLPKDPLKDGGKMDWEETDTHVSAALIEVSLKNSAEVQDPDYGSSMWVTDGWCLATVSFCVIPNSSNDIFQSQQKVGKMKSCKVRWPVKVLPWLSLGSLVFLALQIKGHGGACYHRMEG